LNNRRMNRALAGACALAGTLAGTFASGASAATPVRLDTEQKAAASLVSAYFLANEVPQNHRAIFERVVFYSNRTLLSVSSVTTPAALMATPAGVTVPCGVSGTLTARMAARYPRVLRFSYNDCHFDMFGWPHSLNGTGEIALLSDSFTPERVAAIRFGSDTADLVQTRELVTFDQIDHQTVHRNLKLIGNIPLSYSQYVINGTTIPFAYVIDGFVDESTQTDFPQSGAPPQTNVFHWDLDKVTYAGSIAYSADGSRTDEDLRVPFGTLMLTRTQPNYGTTSEKHRFDGLRVQQVTDFTAFNQTMAIDGKVDLTWNPLFGAGCVNGAYVFKTRVPLRRSFSTNLYDAGELTINGQVRAQLFSAANVPATLPAPVNGTLLHLDVQNVGAFNYDFGDFINGLRPTSHCM
jgi:hypothetical protein